VGKTKVLLVDDHRLMLEAVRFALEQDGDFEIVGATTEATQVVALVGDLLPDVVLLDVRMPQLDGITCLKRIRAAFPEMVVVMLSASEDRGVLQESLDNGARAFVLKHLDPRDLGGVIRQALEGSVFQSAAVFAEAAATLAAEAGLTAKEHEILNLLSRGLTNSEIAKELWVADQTVKFHLSNIYRKLQVKGRIAAVETARRRGLITNPLLQEADPEPRRR
jgi:DNA-binding NarL/FixJ family response regulator